MAERRRFPRVHADVVCRPAGASVFHHRRSTRDVSIGGMRVYTDIDFAVGSRLELEVLLPEQQTVHCWAQVVWRLELDGDAPAQYDVGLRFLDMADADVQRLASVLAPAG